jgi:hypothetical protein
MTAKVNLENARCSATTAAGKRCTYPATRDSDPPLCDLHGKLWQKELDGESKVEFYGRFLTGLENETILAQMARASGERELVVARALVAHLLDDLIQARGDRSAQKVLVPLILRSLKLAADLAKQLQAGGDDDDWDEVLDRLSDELDIDL